MAVRSNVGMRLWPLVVVALSPGCARVEQARQCNAFSSTVSAALVQIRATTRANATSEAGAARDLVKLAELYDQLARDVAHLAASNDELRRDFASYQALCARTARAVRERAEAITAADVARAEAATRDLAAVVKEEDELVGKINARCQSP